LDGRREEKRQKGNTPSIFELKSENRMKGEEGRRERGISGLHTHKGQANRQAKVGNGVGG
jgi:hypothetical protein